MECINCGNKMTSLTDKWICESCGAECIDNILSVKKDPDAN